ncbi:alpha-1,3-arabinosyltransferase XAT3-like [Macadamia integrifolia]|uniref:alpha-1,3-arabinosyltransferase XAT3-like n=1 Tax=Macadamia integrifolia TaxID=60698 RepID=UPI001C52E232|nr:alpha-1,3-arabinosyltransferase XAT3-like [Macadamia integrifolia]
MGTKIAAEPRKVLLTVATSIFLLLLPLIYAMVFSPYNSPLNFWKEVSNRSNGGGGGGDVVSSGSINNGGHGEEDSSLMSLLGRLLKGKDRKELETTGFACKSDPLTDVCIAKQPVWMKIDGVALTVYLSSSSSINQSQNLQQLQLQETPLMVRPYVKKNDDHARKYVNQIKIQALMDQSNTNGTTPGSCDVSHDVPAVVFSLGLTGNIFHELNEIVIPLFLTTHHFRSQIRFVVTDFNTLWARKYAKILSHLSDFEIINTSQDKRVHCFPGAVVGLHYHNDNLVCRKSELPVKCSIPEFRQFLREAFNLKFKNEAEAHQDQKQKPVLVLLSRRHSRSFVNLGEMVRVATVLGFRVIVASPELTTNLNEFSGVVNSCSVLVGAHGAGLTNEVFLPEGAVMVQVVPLGLQWASTNYYGNPLKDMGVHYLEYQISPEESTLYDMYGPDHPVITNPDSIHRQGYKISRPIYVDSQQVRLNLTKFEDTLVQALRLLDH